MPLTICISNYPSYSRHPDKNENPNAEDKFVEIKQAYELLSDSERRKAFDLHGITSEDSTLYKERHDYSMYGRFRYLNLLNFSVCKDQNTVLTMKILIY